MTETTPQAADQGQRRLRIGAVIAVAVAVGFIVWAAIGSGDDNGGGDTSSTTPPVVVSYDGLTTLAAALGQPVYWVGPRGGTRYEVQQLPDGTLYVRYLPADVEAGDPGKYLTVATYPMEDAYSVTSGHATAPGIAAAGCRPGRSGLRRQSRTRTACMSRSRARICRSRSTTRQRGVARGLVSRGAVVSVPTSDVAEAKAVTPRELRQLSASLGQPIYWAGSRPSVTYEVSRTPTARSMCATYPKALPTVTRRSSGGRSPRIRSADAYEPDEVACRRGRHGADRARRRRRRRLHRGARHGERVRRVSRRRLPGRGLRSRARAAAAARRRRARSFPSASRGERDEHAARPLARVPAAPAARCRSVAAFSSSAAPACGCRGRSSFPLASRLSSSSRSCHDARRDCRAGDACRHRHSGRGDRARPQATPAGSGLVGVGRRAAGSSPSTRRPSSCPARRRSRATSSSTTTRRSSRTSTA